MEAIYEFEVKDMPVTVAVDSGGNAVHKTGPREWQTRIGRAAYLVTTKYGVPGLKYAMDLAGYYGGPPRLPLKPLCPPEKREIEDAFQDLRG